MFEEFTDKELVQLYWVAQETRDGRYLKKIKDEMNRRTREQ